MTRIIKLKFTDDNDYADVLVAMRPYMPPGIPTADACAKHHAQAIAAICRAQSAPAKPPTGPGVGPLSM